MKRMVLIGIFLGLAAWANDKPLKTTADGLQLTQDGTELVRVPKASTSVVVPEGVTRIRTRAFYECRNLVSVELPESLRTIDGYAFSRCPKLERLEIKGQVKTFGSCVIEDCNGLRELVLPDGMETVCRNAVFGRRTRLNVRLPRSIRKLEPDAFGYCAFGRMLFDGDAPEGRKDISDDKEAVNLEQNWILYAYEDTKGWPTFGEWKGYPLYRVPRKADRPFVPQKQTDPTTGLSWEYVVEGKGVTIVAVEPYPTGNLMIPAVLGGLPVVKIGRAAFADSRCGDRSLGGSGGLRSVHIPDSVVDIDRCAFDGCSGLKSVRLPLTLRRLGSGVFTWCSGLKSLTVPPLVREIPNATFWGCSNLEAMMFKGDMPEIGEEVFKYVPRVTIYADKRADGWPYDGLAWGFELRRIDKGTDFRAEENRERRFLYMIAEKKDIPAGADVLKKDCKVPDFKFGLDCPIEKIPDVFAWPAFGGKCLEYPVVVDEPFLDMGAHRVLFGQREQVFGHRWIRNEFRHPVDRATRVALYEKAKEAIAAKYGVQGTETRRQAFFAHDWKCVFDTEDAKITIAVDPDGICRPLSVTADAKRAIEISFGGERFQAGGRSLQFMRNGFDLVPLGDCLDKADATPGRWPFDNLPFGKDIGSLAWVECDSSRQDEVAASEECDGLGFGFYRLEAYADRETKKIVRFACCVDVLRDSPGATQHTADGLYTNVCAAIARHYGDEGTENVTGDRLFGDDSRTRVFTVNGLLITVKAKLLGVSSGLTIVVEDTGARNAVRRETLARFDKDRLKAFEFGEVRPDVDIMEMCCVLPYEQFPLVQNPYRLFGRERVCVTPISHKVYARAWYSDTFPSWMTSADISNEVRCLEKALVRLYGGVSTNGCLRSGGVTVEYGESGQGVGTAHLWDEDTNRLVLNVKDDKLSQVFEDENFIDGYYMNKFVFGRNPPAVKPGVGTEFDFDSPEKRWTSKVETIANTDIVCRYVWNHTPDEFTAVGCCHLGDVGADMLDATYRRSKIVIGNTYGVTSSQESVTTNGVVETSVARFRKEPVTVTLTMRREIAGKEKVRSLTIVGEMDEDLLRKP